MNQRIDEKVNVVLIEIRKTKLTSATDAVNRKWGLYTIHSARMSADPTIVQDRISFHQS